MEKPPFDDAIQRILYIGKVHCYSIPPEVPGRGHVAALWTENDNKRQIFTARLRIRETSLTPPGGGADEISVDIILENPENGELFAAAPYKATAVVEPVSDSSRFFALRVQDDSGRKATLGIGFEERSDAFDFSVSLQEAQKTLGFGQGGPQGKKPVAETKEGEKRDLSLKEGETITVNLPGRFGRRRPQREDSSEATTSLSSFSLPPPPSSSKGGAGILPPPPPAPATSSRAKRLSAQNLGFEDGKFG